MRDLDHVRSFMSSAGPTAFFDLPWMPLYVAVCFLFHPWIGFTVLVGAVVICSLALLTEAVTRGPSQASVALAASRHALAEAARRNAALLQALGMRRRIGRLWAQGQRRLSAEAADHLRHGGRARRSVPRPAHDPAVRRARGRRLSGDQPGGDRRHDHRRHHPVGARAGAGRSWRSRTGNRSSPRGKAAAGCRRPSPRCRPSRTRCRCPIRRAICG